LKPTMPQNAAGRITDPLVCVPIAAGTNPAATAAAEPEGRVARRSGCGSCRVLNELGGHRLRARTRRPAWRSTMAASRRAMPGERGQRPSRSGVGGVDDVFTPTGSTRTARRARRRRCDTVAFAASASAVHRAAHAWRPASRSRMRASRCWVRARGAFRWRAARGFDQLAVMPALVPRVPMQDARTIPRLPRFHPDHRAARLEPQRPPQRPQAEELGLRAGRAHRPRSRRAGAAHRPACAPDLALGLLRRARDRRQARFLCALPRRTARLRHQPPFDFPDSTLRARGRSGVALPIRLEPLLAPPSVNTFAAARGSDSPT
jgi:hypothetical protein